MFTTDQKSDLLFKKYLGVGSAGTGSQYFNEPKLGRPAVYPPQIWTNYDSITIPASSVPGICTYITDLDLIPMKPLYGSLFVNAFYHDDLKDAIPFNFDIGGSYFPILKKSDFSIINPGQNDWFIDTEAGMITFYGGLPSGVSDVLPPKLSFWRYIGTKGSPGIGPGGNFSDFMSGQIESPTVDNEYHLVSNNPSFISLKDITISLYSGNGTASLKVDNIPALGLSNIPLSSMEATYTSSFVPNGQPVPTGSRVILELSNMSVGAGRLYFSIGMTRTLLGT